MTPRDRLIALLEAHRATDDAERGDRERMIAFARTLADLFSRAQPQAHGLDTPVPVHEAIDIGVLVGEGNDERALAIAKHVLSDGAQEIVVTTDERPERAGIDPWHRLIDRHPDDNTVPVREASR